MTRWILLMLAAAACGSSGSADAPDAAPDVPPIVVQASDVPIAGLPSDDVTRFTDGDSLFGLPFRPADGLGPLFIRTSCEACHREGSRGPGLVQKLAIVDADGVTPAADQSALPWGHTERPGMAAGATTPITAPDVPGVKVTIRIGPPVFGRGYIEAVDDAELLRVEAAQAGRSDAIHGRANHTTFASVPNPDPTFGQLQTGQAVIGKLGLKARIATLDDFTADAYQGDMGMTTPMRPAELPNPDGLTDDLSPGVDLAQDHIDRVAFYLRRIAIPLRVGLTDRGTALFAQVQCAACHVPSLRTRADYPIPQLAGIDAPIYSDLLLHDMGPALADGQTDGSATPSAWRTAPLIGLRFAPTYLHDGRVTTVTDAVLAHDGEAAGSRTAFQALSSDDQRALIDFVSAL
ncbi:MAG TPA: di-heme oxidoredictase family protein [Kofleriaceae bacterium]|nr:di-heme oxidoredictase family protein [Kofleriaceae bacterium]